MFDPRDDRPCLCAEDGCSKPVCDSSRELCAQHAIRAAIDNGNNQHAYDIASDEGISATYVDQVIAAAMAYAARVARNRLAADSVLATIVRAA
jgi:hypothetical protein